MSPEPPSFWLSPECLQHLALPLSLHCAVKCFIAPFSEYLGRHPVAVLFSSGSQRGWATSGPLWCGRWSGSPSPLWSCLYWGSCKRVFFLSSCCVHPWSAPWFCWQSVRGSCPDPTVSDYPFPISRIHTVKCLDGVEDGAHNTALQYSHVVGDGGWGVAADFSPQEQNKVCTLSLKRVNVLFYS